MCIDNNGFWEGISAIATTCAVLVALFGQAFRDKFFPPKLNLNLLDAAGELTTFTQSSTQVRYYHVRVSNARRWSPAQQVQVMLLGVAEPAADGSLRPIWTGDVPLSWRHQNIFPIYRTIGSDGHVDLCSISSDKVLRLHPLIAPNNLPVVRQEASEFAVTIQAKAAEGDSEPLRLRIAWDGTWEAGALEMQRHLSITALDREEAAWKP